MATQTLVSLECDIPTSKTPHEATVTVDWAFDGVNYVIDLCDMHREMMSKSVARYLAASRIAPPPAPVAPRGRKQGRASTNGGHGYRTPAERQHSAQVREWAREQGLEVNAKGRLSQKIETMYEQSVRNGRAHPITASDNGSGTGSSVS